MPRNSTSLKRPPSRRRSPDYAFERATLGLAVDRPVAGIDEAGRGALAGPVVAAAVVLRALRLPRALRSAIRDSKLLTAQQRARVVEQLQGYADLGVGQTGAAEIDRVGIVQATMQAMCAAVAALPHAPEIALVDGPLAPPLACETHAVPHGDRLSLSVAAASIVAKQSRDAMMVELAGHHPGYGWEHNFGYGTPDHLAALARLGLSSEHRRRFRPVRAILAGESPPTVGERHGN